MIGKTISHYKILSKLGEGGMGVVYKAGISKTKCFRNSPTPVIKDDPKRCHEERQLRRIGNDSSYQNGNFPYNLKGESMDLGCSHTKDFSRRRFLEKCVKSSIAITAGPALLGTLSSCGTSRMTKKPGIIGPRSLSKIISRKFRRMKIAHLPTPLEYMGRLSTELNGPRIFMKRDDQTGLAFGGNKTRKLEYIIADAVDKKSDTIITWGGVQSNWCRQTAAAASMAGMRSILILSKKDASPPSYDGNLLLDAILGADIRLVEPDDDRAQIARQIAEEEHGKGRMPYVVSVGGSHTGGSMLEPLGAISYTNTFLEIYRETQEKNIRINHIVHATGSGGTQGGLCAGAISVDPRISIVGISIGGSKATGQKNIAEIAGTTLEALNLSASVSPEEVIVFDDYVGDGYGILNPETADAIFLLARKEGILLDPVYTGKAMSGLIDLIQKRYFKKDDNVVFIHTGGTPALFPYGQELLEYLRKGDISYYKEFYKLA